MEKTDGLVELLAVEVGKFSIPSNKEITKLANSVRTYISGCLPQEKIPDYYGGGTDKWAWEELRKEGFNACLKSVREALGVGE